MTSRRRRTASAGLLIALGLATTSCGGGADAEPEPQPEAEVEVEVAAEDAAPVPLRGAFADDFDGTLLDPAWRWLHEAEGWPDQVRRAAVTGGALEVEPWTTAWFEDHHGPMVYRGLTGDFVATARVRSRGLRTAVPRKTYSFTGLIARAPRDVTPETWQPGGEDHVFITSGVGNDPGVLNVETKTTDDSYSELTLQPIDGGWTELAIVRVGETFAMLYREPTGDWTLSDTFLRPDLPATLQLGIAFYTDWEDMTDFHSDADGYHRTVLRRHPDLRASVDRITVGPVPEDLDVSGMGTLDDDQLEAMVVPLLR
jgi:hypothetical protein